MKKKKVSITFIAMREEALGHKDLDHLLPFIYFLNKKNKFNFSSSLIILENQCNYEKNLDPRVEHLFNLKNLKIKYLFRNNVLYFFKRLLSLLIKAKMLGKITNILFDKFYINYLEKKISEFDFTNKVDKSFFQSKYHLIISLHYNQKMKKIVSKIKELNKKIKWITIPHGTHTMVNKMLTDTDLLKVYQKKDKKNLNTPDFRLYTSHEDLNRHVAKGLVKGKGHVIGSPRYCKEWLKIKSNLGLDGKPVLVKKKYKVKILFFMPKKFTNIFWDELFRTVNFISSYGEIECILSDYDPFFFRFPNYLKKRDNIRFTTISKEFSTSKLIDWADVIFHAGSSVIFEPIIKEKILVCPRYLTSNTLFTEIYGAGISLRNRDELRSLCNELVVSLKAVKKKYKNNYEHNNKKYINDFVNGNSKSVSTNIVKVMSKIINSL